MSKFLFLFAAALFQGCISDAASVTVGEEPDAATEIDAEIHAPDMNVGGQEPDATESEVDATTEPDANMVGPQGPQGPAGQDGTDGEDGHDGQNGQDGQDGTDGEDGTDGVATAIQFVPAGNACPGGRGFFIVAGPDRDNNGVPDPETAVVSRPLCDGADGQDGENGQDGADGANGPAGRIILVSLDDATPDQCVEGGMVLTYGSDIDNDGVVDEGTIRVLILCDQREEGLPILNDNDGDGYNEDEDCNDNDASVHLGAVETCGDGIDQDCSGGDIPCVPFDSDRDGTPDAQDCAPNDHTVHPGAVEICNDQDDDCDGQIDEGLNLVAFDDLDHDLFGAPGTGEPIGCRRIPNLVYNNEDCNDHNASVRPGAAEVCGDGLDNDCSGGDLVCNPIASVFETTIMIPGVAELMQMNIEPSYSFAELGRRGWTVRSPWAPGPSAHIALDSDEFETQGLCRVRVNVSVGNPVDHRWLCEGAGLTAHIDGTATIRMRIGNRNFTQSDFTTWTPDGVPGGCSAILVLSNTGVCAR